MFASRRILWDTKRIFGMTPTQRVFGNLEDRQINLKELNALEVFGGSGDFHTKDYASEVHSLTVWEINPIFSDSLKKNLPNAQIKITDSFEEIKKNTERYNLIVVDNPMSTYEGHCEHFDLFPDIFRIAADYAIILVNVIPRINKMAKIKYPYIFNKDQLEYRKSFYNTNQPEDISFDRMIHAYSKFIEKNGFNLEWYFFKKRTFVYYLALKIRRFNN